MIVAPPAWPSHTPFTLLKILFPAIVMLTSDAAANDHASGRSVEELRAEADEIEVGVEVVRSDLVSGDRVAVEVLARCVGVQRDAAQAVTGEVVALHMVVVHGASRGTGREQDASSLTRPVQKLVR